MTTSSWPTSWFNSSPVEESQTQACLSQPPVTTLKGQYLKSVKGRV